MSNQPEIEDVALHASRAFGVPKRVTLSASRQKRVVRARAATMHYCTEHLGMTLPAVAEYFGVDHTTVLYHRDRHEDRFQEEEGYALGYDQMRRSLLGR